MIYSQFYSLVKELSDAAKCKPFDHDGLKEMALDPQIRQGAQALAGGSRRDAKVIETAYIASKKRARYALEDSLYKSFGCREEHRLRWSLFVGLMERLHAEEYCQLEFTLTECPTYVWATDTKVYLGYLWRCADKFASDLRLFGLDAERSWLYGSRRR